MKFSHLQASTDSPTHLSRVLVLDVHELGWGGGGAFKRNVFLQCYFHRTGGWAFIEAGAFIRAFTVYAW